MISVTISEPLAQAAISSIRTAFPNTLAIYLFGSRANGTANSDSDLDLAVLVAGYAEPLQLWDISNDLAEIAGYDVDLLDMRAASTVMQYQILQTGRCLWANKLEADLFFRETLRQFFFSFQSWISLTISLRADFPSMSSSLSWSSAGCCPVRPVGFESETSLPMPSGIFDLAISDMAATFWA